ncbi:hypothetical protein [Marinomonas rhodophyticola]|uniref:Uncharacterized protein n=1 Tax=Marinomonas rhodophyticola TaxID=2992803 RepID=A0ABT3KLR4_9GAMM|nr:hypothetical protein [Marinomonas sp. KJ51-3]MCW4631497.1 hypothetical protein [Marinomonas sp. KJ51-3]
MSISMTTNNTSENTLDMGFSALRESYKTGIATPTSVMADIRQRAADYKDHNIWIHLLTESEQAVWLDALKDKDMDTHPLWGFPLPLKTILIWRVFPLLRVVKSLLTRQKNHLKWYSS